MDVGFISLNSGVASECYSWVDIQDWLCKEEKIVCGCKAGQANLASAFLLSASSF